jgi:hypothetical protein
MWTAAPKGWASWDYSVVDEAGRPVAEVSLAFWQERGGIRCAEGEFTIRREQGFGAYVLERNGAGIAWAEKGGLFSRTFTVQFGLGPYTLKPRGMLSRAMVVYEGEREIGRIGAGFWSRRSQVELPVDLPIVLRLFFLWLAMILWRRAAAAADA